jgi:5-formaminoimidazole-4-carboxamide-1-beta-D-ribofuranosyl 5'-monophosphate synthetase
LDLLRQWADQYERWILEQAGIEQPKRQEPGEVLRLVAQ